MSLSTGSATSASSYLASSSSGSGVLRAIEDIPSAIVSGAEAAAEVVGDAASATVSLSARALQALEDGGEALLGGIGDVASLPLEALKGVAVGAGDLVEGGWDLLKDGVSAVASGIGTALHAVVIDLPKEVASVVGDTLDAAGPVATVAADAVVMAGAGPALKAISTVV